MAAKASASLCLVLHAHLPFVRHPEHEDFLEEDWFFEGITETYLPLLDLFERLTQEGIDFRLTLSLSPTLCAMLADDLLRSRYQRYLDLRIDLCHKELTRTRAAPDFLPVVQMYNQQLERCRSLFVGQYHGNLLAAFRGFQDLGKVELMTCCATHGYLPLQVYRQAVTAQLRVGIEEYQRHFGRRPRGIWLSECAYAPGDDELLKQAGIRFFFTETHGILFGTPRPRYGVYTPVYCPSGVAAFGRDTESAKQVWSSEQGYPGDFRYREFYRDLGHDAEYDYIRPYLHSDGVRRNVGLKYYRITGKIPLDEKAPYQPEEARRTAAAHAADFLAQRGRQAASLRQLLGRPPVIVAMYDAELFGHWWFEGVQFLESLFRQAASDHPGLCLITPSEYLAAAPTLQVVQPSMSSWGDKGYHEVWLNASNDWVYRHLHTVVRRVTALADRFPNATGLQRRALNQAAREVLLIQASDWPFLMTVGTAVPYAHRRVRDHVHRFLALEDQLLQGSIDSAFLAELEFRDHLFPTLDYRVFQSGAPVATPEATVVTS